MTMNFHMSSGGEKLAGIYKGSQALILQTPKPKNAPGKAVLEIDTKNERRYQSQEFGVERPPEPPGLLSQLWGNSASPKSNK